MRLGTKLFGSLGLVAAAATIGISPLLANAETVDLDAAAYVGSTTTLNCAAPVTGLLPVDTCPVGGGNGVPLVGGTGSYAFASSVCVGVSVSALGEDNFPDVEANAGCSITSNGTYTNIVCGTGLVQGGNATVTEGSGSDTYSVNGTLMIVFVAGVGVVTATNVTESEASGNDGDTGTAVGLAVLTPVGSQTPPPTGLCVTAFTVVGAVVTNA